MDVCSEIRFEEDCTNARSSSTIPIIDSVAFSARSSTSGSEKNNGKPIPVCDHCKKQLHTRSSVGSYMVIPQEVKKCPSKINRTLDRYM